MAKSVFKAGKEKAARRKAFVEEVKKGSRSARNTVGFGCLPKQKLAGT